ncbi:MAG: STAS domain-containing protein [Spirochaetales bacterium]|nr:STAS domain-containing protein [Spirochaetales bacterium]
MDFTNRTVEGITVLDITGNLGITNIKEFKQRVLTFISQGAKKVILNFDQTKYIDSMGITALITIYTKMKERGVKFKFAAVQGQVKQLLQISKLDKVFPITETFDSAVADLK